MCRSSEVCSKSGWVLRPQTVVWASRPKEIWRAFIKQRETMLAHADVLKRLAQVDASLLQHDEALRVIWRELQPLLSPPPVEPRRRIGFSP